MMAAIDDRAVAPAQTLDVQARVLRDILQDVLRPNSFQVGDLIVQRRDLARYNWPSTAQLAIVASVDVKQPVVEDSTATRDDIIILVLANGEWVLFAVESFRFEKYEGPIA